MSDNEIMSDEESGEDFSASEDEWTPGKKDKYESSDSDFESPEKISSDEEISIEKNSKKSTGKVSKTKSIKVPKIKYGNPKKRIQSLREKLFTKYKPTPKTVSPIKMNQNLTEILDKAQFKKKSTLSCSQDESDSSGDEHLIDPNKVDLSSSYFQKSDEKPQTQKVPEFDCNIGCLSDSDEDSIKSNNKKLDLKSFDSFNKKIEDAKEMLKNYKSRYNDSIEEETVSTDVTALLALGESGPSKVVSPKKEKRQQNSQKRRKQPDDSDDEWEEVDELQEPTSSTVVPKEGLQVVVELPGQEARKRNKIDIETEIKRKLNKIKREHQLDLHKTNILCWIAHMNAVNQQLNNTELMVLINKLVPGQQCYPKDKTDISYFEQISKWYKSLIAVRDDDVYPRIRNRPPLVQSLSLQIKNKAAICKRDYVFIFVILARSIGLQCRIVHNLVTAPIRPLMSDLCRISEKKEEPKTINVKKENKMSSNSKSKTLKVSKKSETSVKIESKAIPQLDGNDDVDLIESKRVTRGRVLKTKTNVIDATQVQISKAKIVSKMSPEKNLINDGSNQTTLSKTKIVEKTSLNSKSKDTKLNTKSQVTSETSSSKVSTGKQKALANEQSRNKITPSSTTSKHFDSKPITQSPEKTKSISNFSPRKTRRTLKQQIQVTAEVSSLKANESTGFAKSNIKKRINTEHDYPLNLKNAKTSKTNTHPSPSQITSKSYKNPSTSATKSQPSLKKTQIQPTKSSPTVSKLLSPKETKSKPATPLSSTTKSQPTSLNRKRQKYSDSDDDDFRPSSSKKISKNNKEVPDWIEDIKVEKPSQLNRVKKIDRRILSTDDEHDIKSLKKIKGCDYWVELYSEKSKRWYCVDLFKGAADCVEELTKQATHPISYVFAWNNDNTLKDVSARYCTQWHTVVRKMRVSDIWLHEAIKGFLGKKTPQDKREDKELNKLHQDQPLPKTINECKDHPQYALSRHLLKFQALYPPDALILGYVRNEPIYSRDCVHTLHSREIWVKQARVVKLNEQPYKIVKAMPKWDRLTNSVIKDRPLEIFGIWQTQDYEPPTAENGLVPRNAYGNVELFKECMLPKKTVHLKLNGLNRTCKKLKIDCAPAVVGFDFHCGSSHPVFDGFVVCEEFAELVTQQWFEDQEELEKKGQEKYEKRVYGNWKKLIRGLRIREILKIKYKYESLKDEDMDDNPIVSTNRKKKGKDN